MTFFYLWRKMFNPGLKKQPGIVGRKLSHEEAHHRITGQGGGGGYHLTLLVRQEPRGPSNGGRGGTNKVPTSRSPSERKGRLGSQEPSLQ